jgi:hypothetical protein
MNDVLQAVWNLVSGKGGGIKKRNVNENAIKDISFDIKLQPPDNPGMESARKAIIATIKDSCAAHLKNALEIQAKHSAEFMISHACRKGSVGTECKRVMDV